MIHESERPLQIGINCLVPVILLTAQQVIAQHVDEGAEKSFSSGMSVALIFFISIFFLTGFASLYIRQCNNRRRRRANGGNTTIFSRSPSLPRGRGLDQAVVNSFPTFLYSEVKDHMMGQRVLECAVCLLEFEDNEILRLLPECTHAFHPNCIDAWLAFRVTCPVCRANLVPKPGQLINNVTTTVSNDSDHQLTSPSGNGIDTDTGTDTGSCSCSLVIDISDYTTTSPELIDTHIPNQSRRPPRSASRRSKSVRNFVNKFRRSHSTGHLFEQEENRERFTLRLPEDVRSQLMKRSPGCSSPAGVFLSVRSPRKAYRSSSVGTSRGKNYERFDSTGRSGVRNFRMTPPSLYQASSVRSAGGDDLMVMGSIKSPLDRLFRGRNKEDDGGERSNRRLIPDAQV